MRRAARTSLLAYARAIDVPGRPAFVPEAASTNEEPDDDEDLNEPLALLNLPMAAHHIVLLDLMQGLMEGTLLDEYGAIVRNAMVFMPPGSAKSTYASVVAPTWIMGKVPDYRLILASYATPIARKQGRRARQIARSAKFSAIWEGTSLRGDTTAADEWALSNDSEFMAGGILSGITGNRAKGLVIDDPVAGRQEADSEATQKQTRDAYEDDLLTRLAPDAWQLIMQTRWNMNDLAGGILPENWRGESGDIACRDGQTWRVLCIPAEARMGDPLGRQPGEMLWPEWFTEAHWSRYRGKARTWSALYQQVPVPDTGDYWRAEWFREVDSLPPLNTLSIWGASDYAVTDHGGDFTVHVVVGIDPEDRPYLLDVWREQTASDVWVESFCDLVLKWHPAGWAEETGQIKAGVGPFLVKRMKERKAYVYRDQFPTRGGDKAVRAQSMRGRIAMQGLYILRSAPWKADLLAELLSFPAGTHDDQHDALGLIGQLLDRVWAGRKQVEEKPKPQPVSGQVRLQGPPPKRSGRRIKL